MAEQNKSIIARHPKIAAVLIIAAPLYFLLRPSEPEVIKVSPLNPEQVLSNEALLNEKAEAGVMGLMVKPEKQKPKQIPSIAKTTKEPPIEKKIVTPPTKKKEERPSLVQLEKEKADKIEKAKSVVTVPLENNEQVESFNNLEKMEQISKQDESMSEPISLKSISLSESSNLFIRFKTSNYFKVAIEVNGESLAENDERWVVYKVQNLLKDNSNNIKVCFKNLRPSADGLNAKKMVRVELISSVKQSVKNIERTYSEASHFSFLSPSAQTYEDLDGSCYEKEFLVSRSLVE